MIASERCARARLAVSAALDGEASEADVLIAVTHVRLCRGCREFLIGVRATLRALLASRVIRPSSSGQRG